MNDKGPRTILSVKLHRIRAKPLATCVTGVRIEPSFLASVGGTIRFYLIYRFHFGTGRIVKRSMCRMGSKLTLLLHYDRYPVHRPVCLCNFANTNAYGAGRRHCTSIVDCGLDAIIIGIAGECAVSLTTPEKVD